MTEDTAKPGLGSLQNGQGTLGKKAPEDIFF